MLWLRNNSLCQETAGVPHDCHFLNCLQGDGQLDEVIQPLLNKYNGIISLLFLHLSTTDRGATNIRCKHLYRIERSEFFWRKTGVPAASGSYS